MILLHCQIQKQMGMKSYLINAHKETMMSELRNKNEEIYKNQKTPNDSLKNAELCETIADYNFMWHVEEAIYWRKKALKIREKIDGKSLLNNVCCYEKIIDLLMEKGSYKEALKWSEKAQKLNEKLHINNLSIEIYYAEIHLNLKCYNESIKHGDLAFDIITSEKFVRMKSSFKLVNRLLIFYARYIIYYDNEKKSYDKLFNCMEIALRIAQEFYGDNSIEVAIVYREKAVYLDISKQEKLTYLKKALDIVLSIGKNTKLALEIFYNIRGCWPASESLEEGFKWVYENVSKQFILDVLPQFTKPDQEKIKIALNI